MRRMHTQKRGTMHINTILNEHM